MTPEQVWVLGLLAGAFLLLVFEIIPPGITGLLTIVGLIVGEIVVGDVAKTNPFAGMINNAVLAVGSMFVISAGVSRTGAVGLFTDIFMKESGNPRRQYFSVLIFVMVASAFLNNTPLVLIFMPMVLGLAGKMNQAPSKLLIPLSFISIMGGMCTLVGTSTNIVVQTAASKHGLELEMWDFTPMGLILAAAGVIFLFTVGERLLPERASLGLSTGKGLATEYMTELELSSKSKFVGSTLGAAFPRGKSEGVRVLQLIRGDVIHPARKETVLESGDLLMIKGDPAAILRLHERQDTGTIPTSELMELEDAPSTTRRVALTLVEVIVSPGTRWIDRRVRDVRFRERYGVGVIAVQRHGSHLREKVGELKLKPGDILLVQGDAENLANLKTSENFFVVEGIEAVIPHTRRAPIAIGAILIFLVWVMLNPKSVHVGALISAVVMVLGRCVTAAEAYASLDFDVLFLLGGTLALGQAFDDTELAGQVAIQVVRICEPMGLHMTLGGIFLFTALITQFLSNNAAAAIMTPLAFSAGLQFHGGSDPEVARSFVMAVAFGASCCFLTPIGYGTNLIVYGPGGYKFSDFLRIGLPLTVLFTILATIFLAVVY